MTATRFYAMAVVVLAVGLVLIVLFPEVSLIALTIAVPFAIVGAAVSTIYLARVFQLQPVPRSRFFRMLVETFFSLMLIGVWIGYLTVARILERAALTDPSTPVIPAPPTGISAPISALVVLIAFAAPIRFAVEVYRRRKLSALTDGSDNDLELDREDEAHH